MRPHSTTALTPENFGEFVQSTVDGKKTAFVRYMMSADEKECKWFEKGLSADGHTIMANGEAQVPDSNHAKPDPCDGVRTQAKAWNEITKKYADNTKVVFGDVVISDWPEIVKSTAEHAKKVEARQAQQKAIAAAQDAAEQDDDSNHEDSVPLEGAPAHSVDGKTTFEVFEGMNHTVNHDADGGGILIPGEEVKEGDGDGTADHPTLEDVPKGLPDDLQEDDHGDEAHVDDGDLQEANLEPLLPEDPHDEAEDGAPEPEGALDAHPKTHDGEEIDYMAVEKHEEPTGEKPQEAGVEVGIEAKDEAAGEKSKSTGPDGTDFAQQLAEIVHDPEIAGCTIRHYNLEQPLAHDVMLWSPSCTEMLDPNFSMVAPVEDSEGNEAAEPGPRRLMLEHYVDDTISSLERMAEGLQHMDEL